MAVDVAVYPNLALLVLREVFEQLLDVEDLWVVLQVRVDPLSVQVYSCHRVPVVSTNHSIWVQHRNENECVELPEELGLLLVRCDEVEDSLEDCTGRCLTRVHSTRYYDGRLFLDVFSLAGNGYLPERQAADGTAQFLSLVVD